MLSIFKRRKKIEKFIYQALRDIVKEGGENVIKQFEDKFREIKGEGCRRDGGSHL